MMTRSDRDTDTSRRVGDARLRLNRQHGAAIRAPQALAMSMALVEVRPPSARDLAQRARGAWIVIPLVIAVVIGATELTRPEALFGVVAVDDGVYFGAAVRLIDGVLPYRDFVLLHPPGVEVLLTPIALLSHLIGTRDGLAVARIVTALVTIANVGLVAGLLRQRGRVAAGVAATGLAAFPLAVAASSTVTLEPYFVLFSLLGARALFSDRHPTTTRAWMGGAALAVAVDIKLWAIIPAVVALVCAGVGDRRLTARAGGGFLIALAVLAGPFVASAPGAFFHDVVTTQFDRAHAAGGPGLAERLFALTGASAFAADGATLRYGVVVAVVTVVVIGCAVGVGRRRVGRLEAFAFVSWALLVVAVCSTNEFYAYYAYAPAAFEALALGCAIGLFARRGVAPAGRPARHRAAAIAFVVVGVATALLIERDEHYVGAFIAASDPFDPSAAIASRIPAGACVVTDQMSLLIDANRVTATAPDCPAIVDPYGTWLAADPLHPPPSVGPYAPSLVGSWDAWLGRADYLLLEFPIPRSPDIPGAPSTTARFEQQFRPIVTSFGANLYRHIGSAAAPSP
jgi:alpha-1,2-mannosyltransferase